MSKKYKLGVNLKFLNGFLAFRLLGKKYFNVIFYEILNNHYVLVFMNIRISVLF